MTRSDHPGGALAGPADLLRRHGVRVTAQRLAVLRAVSDRPHSTADEAAELARAEIGAISRQAVYDALGALTDSGILRRIQPAGSPARYEHQTGEGTIGVATLQLPAEAGDVFQVRARTNGAGNSLASNVQSFDIAYLGSLPNG